MYASPTPSYLDVAVSVWFSGTWAENGTNKEERKEGGNSQWPRVRGSRGSVSGVALFSGGCGLRALDLKGQQAWWRPPVLVPLEKKFGKETESREARRVFKRYGENRAQLRQTDRQTDRRRAMCLGHGLNPLYGVVLPGFLWPITLLRLALA